MHLLQAPSLWNVEGSITVVGILLVAVIALYLGFLTPKHTVQDLRDRLKESEAENTALNNNVVKRIEENAELRGEVAALRRDIEDLRREINLLRGESAGRRSYESHGEQGSQGGRA